MSVFTQRPGGFKAGVFLLFFSTLLFFVSFVCPFWASATQENANRYSSFTLEFSEGLWMTCVKTTAVGLRATSCGTSGLVGFPDWFHASRVMACLGMVGLVVACICTLATNCCRAVAGPRSRFLEILTACAGLLAFIGCMVYLGLRNKPQTTGDALTSGYTSLMFSHLNWTFSWAVYLAAFSSPLSIIAAILIGVFNKPVEASTPPDGVVMSTMPVGPSPYGPSQAYVAQPAGYAYGQAY